MQGSSSKDIQYKVSIVVKELIKKKGKTKK